MISRRNLLRLLGMVPVIGKLVKPPVRNQETTLPNGWVRIDSRDLKNPFTVTTYVHWKVHGKSDGR